MTVSFGNAHSLRDQAGMLSLIVLLHIGGLWALTLGPTVSSSSQPTKVVSAFMVQAAPAAPVATETQPTVPQPKPVPPQPDPKPKPRTKPKPQATKPAITAPSVKPAPEPEPELEPVATAPSPPPSLIPASSRPAAAVTTGQAPVTAAPTPAPPKTITSGVEYLSLPSPKYPLLSRRMGEEGKVVLRVLINERGNTDRIDVQQSSGSSRLDQAAREAVKMARFQPYIENGRAIAVFAIVPIVFKLDN